MGRMHRQVSWQHNRLAPHSHAAYALGHLCIVETCRFSIFFCGCKQPKSVHIFKSGAKLRLIFKSSKLNDEKMAQQDVIWMRTKCRCAKGILFLKLFNCSTVRSAVLSMFHLPFEACQIVVISSSWEWVCRLPSLQGLSQAQASQRGRQPRQRMSQK